MQFISSTCRTRTCFYFVWSCTGREYRLVGHVALTLWCRGARESIWCGNVGRVFPCHFRLTLLCCLSFTAAILISGVKYSHLVLLRMKKRSLHKSFRIIFIEAFFILLILLLKMFWVSKILFIWIINWIITLLLCMHFHDPSQLLFII